MRRIKSLFFRIIFATIFLLLIFFYSEAQVLPVTIKVTNQKKEPLSFATILIENRLDSLKSYMKIADSSGIARFDLKKNEQYIVSITSLNYQFLKKNFAVSGNQSVFSFTVEPIGKTLETVTIISQKPLMRQEDDKTIVDPENLVAASTSGYEVIEKTPGLFVDQDGNIYISSLTPASVQINGREMKMSASDVATILKSLPPNSIDRIEIIRTPSARYDASGGGGVVNVVLKKGVKIGLTGSVTAGLQQGTYGNQFAGLNLNNNDGKKSTYINLNYSKRNSYERIITDRLFAPDSILSQSAYTKYPSDIFYAGFGINYFLNAKWEINYDARASLNDFNNQTQNQSIIKKISTSQLITDNLNQIKNSGTFFNISNDISSKYKIDTVGSEWTSNISYTYAHTESEQRFNTSFYTPTYPTTGGYGYPDNDRYFFTVQSDLKQKLNKKLVLETGIKTSLLKFKSETVFYKETISQPVKDPTRTNTFNYKENINSFYLQGSKTFGKDIVLKVGSRLENTNMDGRQLIPADTTYTINRTDLFPYVYLSKNIMKIAGYELRAYLVYRRTIRRPVYEQLNPFSRYIDQYLSETGNPSLRPQFNQNYEANISVDERPIFAIGINDTKDIFTNVIYQSDTSQSQAFRTYDNLGKNKEWYFRGLGALPQGGVYFFVLGAQYNHNFYQGLYENKPLAFKKGTWTFFTYQTLKLDKKTQVTLNGFLRLKGQQQFYELTTFGALNTSINRRFLKDKLIVTLSLSDMFATNKNNFTIKQGSVNASGYRQSDTRRFGINLRYNFGTRKKDENNTIFNLESPEKTN